MNIVKATVAGAIGFAVGAGAMMMPGNQKMRKQAVRQWDKIAKKSKMW